MRMLVLGLAALVPSLASAADVPARPNVLWITWEDSSPLMGCYGDPLAITPNLDRVAARGVRYTHAFSVAGVCAPSRSCLITGVYPSSLGTQHMRCTGTLPPEVVCFTEHLRKAGYYCSNNAKTDYNFSLPKVPGTSRATRPTGAIAPRASRSSASLTTSSLMKARSARRRRSSSGRRPP